MGVTTIQDMTADAAELRAYQALRASNELTARIYSIQNHGIAGLRDAGVSTGFGHDWLRIGGIKLFADGSMGAGTAVFFEPYTDDPKTSGLLIQSPEALEKAMVDADAAGFQLIVHAIGDRANAIVLDILERMAKSTGARDWRPRIEHVQVVRDEDKKRFKSAGRDRVDPAEPLHRRHALGRSPHRPGAQRASPTTSSPSSTPAHASRSAPTGSSSR